MTPEQRKRILELEQEKRRRQAPSGERETGEDDGEGESESTAGETLDDSMRAAQRGITFGLNDVAAGVGAAAGDAVQSALDKRPRNPNAYAEGRDEERAGDEAARQRSPNAFGRAELGGALLTAPLFAARPLQAARGGSSVMGLAPAATTALQRAAPTVARFAKGAGAGALASLGFGDVDDLKDVPGAVATGAAMGAAGEALAPLLPYAAGRVVKDVKGAPGAISRALKPAAAKAGAVIDAAADMVPDAMLPAAARKSAKSLKEFGTPEALEAPAANLTDDELQRILDDLYTPDAPKQTKMSQAESVPDPTTAPVAAVDDVDARKLALDALDDVPEDTGRASARMDFEDAAPELDATGRPMVAQPVDDAELAAMIAELTNSPEYRRTVAMSQTPAVARQSARETAGTPMRPTLQGDRANPLEDIIARVRREQAAGPDTNPVAIDDAAGRQPRAVASVKQQELWRKTYDALPANKRQEYLAQIKAETGLPDDTIRQRLKLTKAEWARKSFNR